MPEELAYAILAVLCSGLLVQFLCAVYLFKLNRRIDAVHVSNKVISAVTHDLMKEHTSELQKARLRVR